jgi:hypothetical protein
MADGDSILVQRAAGAVLRALKRKGTPPQRLATASREEPLRPALAIEALLAGMRARFRLTQAVVDELLRPAVADWRDAVGCADPLLVAANAQGANAEPHLVPIPIPSWCTGLVEAGLIRLDGPPALDGPRVVQRAWLAVIRETELTAVECYPLAFAGRYGSGAASLQIHLALSPPFLADGWRGAVFLRAGAQRLEKSRAPAPVRLWLGPPASPGQPATGIAGETSVTWVMPRASDRALAGWPAGWPRWAVLRVLEGREPQALWELPALWRARTASSPEASLVESISAAPGTLRLAVDLGSTSTLVVEEDSAAAGSIGAKLLPDGSRRPVPSGLRRLAGDPATAYRVGCAEQLLAPAGQLPTALAAATPRAVVELLQGPADAREQLWLPQAPGDDYGGPFLVDRFKSPELLLLSEWLAQVAPAGDRTKVSRQLLDSFAWHLGRALAAAHAAPLVTPEGGRWSLRAPALGSVEAVVTYPDCPFDSGGGEPFRTVFEQAAAEICRGLSSAWAETSYRLVPDPAAARAGRGRVRDERHPIEAFVDFGGLTLQVTVRVPEAPGRPRPFIAGSSTSYLLGGERLIDAAAFARADRDAPAALREAYRGTARAWRALIASGGALQEPEAAGHARVGKALLELVLGLVQRQVEGTLRRAAPDGSTLRGAGLRLHLLGEGWKLAALDVDDERREVEMLRRVEECLQRRPLPTPLQLQRLTKRRVCEGALRVRQDAPQAEASLELQGVDVASPDGLRQRWFGVPDAAAKADPDLRPHPDDPWWQDFAPGAGSLLRVEQWFSGPAGGSPFETGLSGGNLSFDGRRSILKQWIDVSGPSLVALRIRQALQP